MPGVAKRKTTAAERRTILNTDPVAKLVWIWVLILEGIDFVFLLIGIVFAKSFAQVLTGNIPVVGQTAVTVGYWIGASLYLLFPLLYLSGTYRLDRWVRWVAWLNALLTLPSMFRSVGGFLGGLLAVSIAAGYTYIIREVDRLASVPLATQPVRQLSSTTAKWARNVLIVVALLGLVSAGVLAWRTLRNPNQLARQLIANIPADANRRIGNVNIPYATDPGRFMGKLEQLDFVASDLPPEFGPYTKDLTGSNRGYAKDPVATLQQDKDAQQYYVSVLANSKMTDAGRAEADVILSMFINTYGSSLYYGLEKQAFERSKGSPSAVPLEYPAFTSIPYDHYVLKGPIQPGSATLDWDVHMLVSNAVVWLSIVLPNTVTDAQAEGIVSKWLAHVDAYQPGTRADVLAENASGK